MHQIGTVGRVLVDGRASRIRENRTRSTPLSRFIISAQSIQGSSIVIDDARELHHLRNVLRLSPGDRVTCFDGQGAEYVGTIQQILRRSATISIEQSLTRSEERPAMRLLAAVPKGERFEWLVQKATELGVQRISPLLTRHGVLRPVGGQAKAKCERWRRVAQEAAKQCGRSRLPTIDELQPFEQAIDAIAQIPLILMPTLVVSAVALSEVLNAQPVASEVAVLIGPEGDFSLDEVTYAQTRGARPVSLGRLTLRSETAALVTVTVVRYMQGGLS